MILANFSKQKQELEKTAEFACEQKEFRPKLNLNYSLQELRLSEPSAIASI